jgi:uncharacterized membrane protein
MFEINPDLPEQKRKNTRKPACFSRKKKWRIAYGFFGLAAGAVVVVVVVAGLVAGFSVVVVTGFLFRAVMTSVVKSMPSFEYMTTGTLPMLCPDLSNTRS